MSTPFEDLPNTPFGALFDELDDVDELLNDGPAIGEGESEKFLSELVTGLESATTTAKGLTAADVDAEFTDETGDDDNGDEGDEIEAAIQQIKQKGRRRSGRGAGD